MKAKRKKRTVTTGPTNSTDKLKQNMGYNSEKGVQWLFAG